MEFLIVLIAFVVVLTGGMYGFSVLASKLLTRAIQDRLHALQEIVEGKVPDVWLKPFRRRTAALRRNAASEARFARLAKRIQKRCLRHLEEMTQYTSKINFTDSELTQKEIVGLLQTYQKTWPTKDWREWIAAVEALDTPRGTKTARNDVSSADLADF